MTKYKQYFNKMLTEHKQLFDQFQQTHAQYMRNRQAWQVKFNSQGEKIAAIVQDYENRLCSHSEKGQFGKFSDKLAEKFQAEVKKHFPLIDFIGITITTEKTPQSQPNPISSLRKINL